jgi:hypothetical protein
MDFPKFEGSDVRIWLDKCRSYFSLFQIPDAFRVTAALTGTKLTRIIMGLSPGNSLSSQYSLSLR